MVGDSVDFVVAHDWFPVRDNHDKACSFICINHAWERKIKSKWKLTGKFVVQLISHNLLRIYFEVCAFMLKLKALQLFVTQPSTTNPHRHTLYIPLSQSIKTSHYPRLNPWIAPQSCFPHCVTSSPTLYARSGREIHLKQPTESSNIEFSCTIACFWSRTA